ncbi:MAG: CBS domain-containing protein [Acidimicrobiia bacterium]
MDRFSPVRDVMTTEVVTLSPDDTVETALRTLLDSGVDAAPVVDGAGVVVGMLSDADLIVRESQLHFPTVVTILGASIELGQKRFDDDLRKALGARVADVMSDEPFTCGPDESIERAATVMHDEELSRLPVLDGDGRLVGLISRKDVLRAILAAG